jgi:hypothetical chaperone protein
MKKRKDKIGVGIDFGTSNSSVAIFNGRTLRMLPIDPNGVDPTVMPTALYIDRNFKMFFGTAAINRYIQDNTGRHVRLTKHKLRDIQVTYGETGTFKGREEEAGDTTMTVEVHALVDQEMPGRLFRSLKRTLPVKNLERVSVFYRHLTVVALITIILKHIRERVEEILGYPIDHVYIGRPIHYASDDPVNDEIAIKRMHEACKYAGFSGIKLYYEPVAASLSYPHTFTSKSEKILVLDFGGGTLDLSITEVSRNQKKVLGVAGLPIGGDLFDRLIYQYKILPELGKGCFIHRENHLFPFWLFEDNLLNWQQTYLLNTPDKIETITRGMHEGGETEEKLSRLYTLITENYSYLMYKVIEEAKLRLSMRKKTSILMEELFLKKEITRHQFEEYIKQEVYKINECIKDVLLQSQLKSTDIDHVVRTGGSSRIPIVKTLLNKRFPGRVREHDVFTSIAAGLAIAAFYEKSIEV